VERSVRERVIIVGGGIAGLVCATELRERGREVLVLEASDAVGGRIRTDTVDGFRVDRGFQVLLTAYPTCREVLDIPSLNLGRFEPGAMVRVDGRFVRIGDPLRRPSTLLDTAFAPVGGVADKLRTLTLRRRSLGGEIDDIWRRPAVPTLLRLHEVGFSSRMIDRFLRPFLGGIFLERELDTSSRMLEFVWRMFSTGAAALPADGMGAITRQLADRLDHESIRCKSPVQSVTADSVTLRDGEVLNGSVVVVAADASTAAELIPGLEAPTWRAVTHLAFDAPEAPVGGPWLVLNGEGHGPVNNLCVPSEVCPSYAPVGRSLVSVTVLDDGGADDSAIEDGVRQQLQDWFGSIVEQWRLLTIQRVRKALPGTSSWLHGDATTAAPVHHGIVLCGDAWTHPSIEGAVVSGKAAADHVTAGG
jgi:phytoene dehydrogenase-like protein